MKFTLSLLKLYLETDSTLAEITDKLTMIGLEVEEVIDRSSELKDFITAEIISAKPHPQADKLQICEVNNGSEILQIVCGATNARAGIKVVLAQIGAIIPNGKFKIKESKIRGVTSQGMLCSADELLLDMIITQDGIIELPENTPIGSSVIKLFGLDDPIININVTPNRGDALSVYGVARDLAAAGIGTLRPFKVAATSAKFTTNFSVNIENNKLCPVFALQEIRNVKNSKSPDWLQQRLSDCGFTPISTLVDIGNYVMLITGQPLHIYDADKLNGKEFVIGTIEGDQQKLQALNDKEYELQDGDLVVKNNRQVECLAGIIGAIHSACDDATRNVVIEAANFAAEPIIKTGQRLQIDSESRYRFARRINQEMLKTALNIASTIITEICGGECSNIIYKGTLGVEEKIITCNANFIRHYTNLSVNTKNIIDILEKIGANVSVTNNDQLAIKVPSWRHDINIKEDIAEEVARLYGYDYISITPLTYSSIILNSRYHQLINTTKTLLTTHGYYEICSWSFVAKEDAALFVDKLNTDLEIINPISSELSYMRPTIFINLLNTIGSNLARSFKDLAFFEIGPVFNGLTPEAEGLQIAAAICGTATPKNSQENQRLVDVFDLKYHLENVLNNLGYDFTKCKIIQSDVLSYYHPNRAAKLMLGNKIVGYFGQLHPNLLEHFKIDCDVLAFELDLTSLPISSKLGIKKELQVSNFQATKRDYAFIVDDKVPVGDILQVLQNTNKQLIKAIDIFDIYKDEKIGEGRKSVALSVQIQSDTHTLNEQELNDLQQLIINTLKEKFKAELRF